MQRLCTTLAMTSLAVLMGCSSYVKQPTVCIDQWYGYASEQGCSSTKTITAPDSSQGTDSRLAASERERQRLTEQLEAAQRQNGALSNRVNELEGQLAGRDREITGLRSDSGDNAHAASQLTAVQQELRQSQDNNNRLADELTAAQRRIADLEGQLAAAQSSKQAESPMAKLEKARQGLIRKLKPQVDKGDITIDLNNERLLIKLASRYLFGSGEDQLRPAGADALRQVGEVLKDYPEYAVAVEGHTDNRPLRITLQKKFASNQELSEARATSAAKALANGGLSSTTTKGFADTNPVASNNSETDRAKNRRVEIRVTK